MRGAVRHGWEWFRGLSPRRKVAIGAGGLAGLGALLLAVLTWAGSWEPSPGIVGGGTATPETPDPVGSSAAPSDDGDWTALELAPFDPVADLVADASDGSSISTGTAFTLRSLTTVPAAELASGLETSPHVELAVEAGSSADVVTVRPSEPLAENARYDVSLRDADGALVGSWTFRTGGPLRVVRYLPDDRSTQVPTDTGIEIEFNQDGAVGVEEHFTIEPAVEGRFEHHGRTWVFVPATALDPTTLYTVTVDAGIGMDGSDRTLSETVRFAFETAGAGQDDDPRVVFRQPMSEVRPDDPPVIAIDVWNTGGSESSMTVEVGLYELPTIDEVLDAVTTLSIDRGWASRSANGSIPTAGLHRAAAFEANVTLTWPNQLLHLPTGLAAGWYLLDVPQDGRPAQVVLQVTDLSAYVLASQTRTVAWVNDLADAAPVPATAVSLADGTTLGQTNADGILDVPTPAPLLAVPDGATGRHLLVVAAPDGRRIVASLGGEGFSPFLWRAAASDEWWLLFGTDRLQYRADDTIRVWGLIRSRADRSVPGDLELRLVSGLEATGPPIARTAVTATARGTIVGELPVAELPSGQFSVALFVGDEPVTQASVTITTIRKPAFRIDVETDRRAYISGDTVEVITGTRFYDGTAAPGLELRTSASAVTDDSQDRVVTADATGEARLTYRARTGPEHMDLGMVHVSPAQPEEGSSTGSASFVVFPSAAWVEGEATLENGTLTVSGRVSEVDLAAAGAQLASDGWAEHPAGDALSGRRIDVEADAVWWRRVESGSRYDFIEKRNVRTYEYEREEEPVGAFERTSDAGGSFRLSIPVGGAPDGVEVTLAVADDEGRRHVVHLWAGPPSVESSTSTIPYLETPNYCGGARQEASIGDNVALTVFNPDGTPSAEGRTLFVVGRLGVDDVVVSTGAELERAFTDVDLPNLTVRAIRLTTAGYVVLNDADIQVAADASAMEVTVRPDLARYAPGEEVSLAITTTGPDGEPLAADVIVQAIDLKLYAIGAAEAVDVSPLMRPVQSGFLTSYASHRVPTPASDCGFGATTGGGDGPRDDFEDVAAFELVSTGPDGRGSATFELPDDLTSWAVSATAVGDPLRTGTGSVEIPVGLPFFVDATLAPEYLAGEEPIVQLRAYGDGLADGDAVEFTIEAPSLGIPATTVAGRAFEAVRTSLPALPLGVHELTISAERVGADPELGDAVLRTIRVVPTRLRTLRTAYETVSDHFEPVGGDGLTTYVVTDGGRGALLPALHRLVWSSSARFDATLAAELSRQLLISEFGADEATLPASGFVGATGHPEGGLALFPYASADLFLTARAALVAPERLDADHIGHALRLVRDDDDSRERRIVALAGLAGIGQDVLGELRAFDVTELTVRERTWLALGLLASGDESAARAIERSILAAHGQRLGPWVRLDLGASTPETAEISGSMLLLAAGLRDQIAIDLARYLLDNPPAEHLPALEQVGYARAAVEWLPRAQARFAWSVDGTRAEQTLERGSSFTLTLTAGQRDSLELEVLDGEVLVATTWAAEADYGELPDAPTLSIARVLSPPDHAPADDLVHVTLNVTIDAGAPRDCYQVTDLVPSGLAPVATPLYGWGGDPQLIAPYEVEGQRVSWCVGRDPAHPTLRLGYSARVVTPGTYRWEPAVIQSLAAAELGASTEVRTYTID